MCSNSLLYFLINNSTNYDLNNDDIKCEVYNLGNSNPVTLNTFIENCGHFPWLEKEDRASLF